MPPATAMETTERLMYCQILVELVEQEAAELRCSWKLRATLRHPEPHLDYDLVKAFPLPACSPLQALPESLAAKVEHLSQKLGKWNAFGAHQLQEVLKAGGSDLATSLQRIYCEGSLLTRFCTLDAMEQDPATVGAFLLGLYVGKKAAVGSPRGAVGRPRGVPTTAPTGLPHGPPYGSPHAWGGYVGRWLPTGIPTRGGSCLTLDLPTGGF